MLWRNDPSRFFVCWWRSTLATHRGLVGSRRDPRSLPSGLNVVSAEHDDRQTTLVVRADAPVDDPAWTATPIPLEDIVLAYLRRPNAPVPAASFPVSENQETLRSG
ncbi:hypothetical protein [Streptomyces europaeiscabiei]|uniref:hypothetical protein n=1 Tax=Streptomyces europaeiscabiei TaxID=146819 RepID=UPI0029B86C00|nr:hypothetical protein [Streptomyces europaeiscabiei]MDX3611687.1 hypothetical protein [Streptomyces europaeiscabiei]